MGRKSAAVQVEYNDRVLPEARTLEQQQNNMAMLAMDLVEKRLRNGTATSQEVCHFLSLVSDEAILKKEKLAKETELLGVKADNIKTSEHIESLYTEAIAAMRTYTGQTDDKDGDVSVF